MKLKSNIITLSAIAFLQLIVSCEKVDLSDIDTSDPEVEVLPMDTIKYEGTVEVIPDDSIKKIINGSDNFPELPFMLNGHVVIDVNRSENWLMLLSHIESHSIPSYYHPTDSLTARKLADEYSEYGLSGWRIPTEYEAGTINLYYSDEDWRIRLNKLLYMPMVARDGGSNVYYLCEDGKMKYSISPTVSSVTKAGAKTKYNLRLVKIIDIPE